LVDFVLMSTVSRLDELTVVSVVGVHSR